MTNRPEPSPSRVTSYVKALLSNYWVLFAGVASQVISVPLLIRWLGRDKFGMWLMLLQGVYVFSLALTWVSAPVAREAAAAYVRSNSRDAASVFQTMFLFLAAMGTGLIVLSVAWIVLLSYGAVGPFKSQDFGSALATMTLYAAIAAQFWLLSAVLTGFQRMHVANLLNGFQTLLAIFGGLFAVSKGFRLTGLALGQFVSMGIITVLAWRATRRIEGVALGVRHASRAVFRRIARRGASYLGYSLSYLVLQSDILIAGILLGAGPAAVYGIAYKVADYSVQLIWKVADSLFPIVAELDARTDHTRLRRIHHESGRIGTSLAILAGILYGSFGRDGFVVWVGASNAAPRSVLVALASLIVVQVFLHQSVSISFGTGRMASITALASAEALAKVGLALMLVPRLGLLGIAVSTLLAQAAFTLWYAPFRACLITEDSLTAYIARVFAPTVVPAIVASLIAGLVLVFVQGTVVRLLVGAPLVAVTYGYAFARIGITERERRWLISRLKPRVGGSSTGAT